MLRILAFPLLLLLFLFPIPAIVYARVTLPLQIFASATAETDFELDRHSGPARRQYPGASARAAFGGGSVQRHSLAAVAVFLALIYAYFFDQKVWMRWVLLAATIPIAIAANAARVTLTGVLSEYSAGLAHGAFHLFEGWVLFVVALGLLITVHQLCRNVRRSS